MKKEKVMLRGKLSLVYERNLINNSYLGTKCESEIAAKSIIYNILSAENELAKLQVREMMYALYVDKYNKLIGYALIGVGHKYATIVNVPYIIKIALDCGAKGIILTHNHPDGALRPSNADREITEQVAAAAKVMDMQLLDHIIVAYSEEGNFIHYSMSDDLGLDGYSVRKAIDSIINNK